MTIGVITDARNERFTLQKCLESLSFRFRESSGSVIGDCVVIVRSADIAPFVTVVAVEIDSIVTVSIIIRVKGMVIVVIP